MSQEALMKLSNVAFPRQGDVQPLPGAQAPVMQGFFNERSEEAAAILESAQDEGRMRRDAQTLVPRCMLQTANTSPTGTTFRPVEWRASARSCRRRSRYDLAHAHT